MSTTLAAILLGILEGLTEFLPVSSTGHLILAQGFFGYDPAQWRQFNIVIQLGAILAVVVSYWSLFWSMGTGLLKGDAQSVRFVRNIFLGFLPAAVIGLLAKDAIDVMLESPLVVAGALIVGGIAILVLEKIIPARPDHGVAALSWKSCLTIGLVQCLAMVPGEKMRQRLLVGRRRPNSASSSLCPPCWAPLRSRSSTNRLSLQGKRRSGGPRSRWASSRPFWWRWP